MMSDMTGRCLCGKVQFRITGEINWAGHCHCESCRRTTSSPFTSFFGVSHGGYQFTGEAAKIYCSSPGVQRHFCGHCGAPIAYQSDRFAHELHFYAACLDKPEDYQPQFHVHCKEQLPWLVIDDELPRYDQGTGN